MAEMKTYGITLEDKEYIVTVEEMYENEYMVTLDGQYYPVSVREIGPEPPEPGPEPEPEENLSPTGSTGPTGTENGENTEHPVESDDENSESANE